MKTEALSVRPSDGLVSSADDRDLLATVPDSSQDSSDMSTLALTTTVQELREQVKFLGDKLSAEVLLRQKQAVELRATSAELARMHRKMHTGFSTDERQKWRGPQRDRRANCPGFKHHDPKPSHWSSRLREHIEQIGHKNATAPKWPLVSVEDCALGSGDVRKIIRIIAPGVGEDEISVDVLPNGARVSIIGSSSAQSLLGSTRAPFQQDFLFDVRVDGILELREDECHLDKGILLLVLRQTPPRQIRVGLAASKHFPESRMETAGLSASVSTCGSSPQFFSMTPAMSECGSWPTQSICDEDFESEPLSSSENSVVTPALPMAGCADFLHAA